MNPIHKIIKKFSIDGNILSVTHFGDGLINESFKVITTENQYFLQKINHSIFKDVEGLQSNIILISKHIEKYLESVQDPEMNRKRLKVIFADNQSFVLDNGSYWRMFEFIQNSKSYNQITPALAAETGRAIAEFQKVLSTIEVDQIVETIPHFHNLEFRLQQFETAVKMNLANRLVEVKDIVDQLKEYKDQMISPERWFREGKIRKYIQHCDTKINNLLFDTNDQFLCMVDLDTCMPNFVFSDVGDFARTACSTAPEDESNLARIEINTEIYTQFMEAYLGIAKQFLTQFEIEQIHFAPLRMTYMQTIRFLTDYLNGDTYYKIKVPGHNLQRTRAQFRLFQKWIEYKAKS